jgi:hypothetical protein
MVPRIDATQRNIADQQELSICIEDPNVTMHIMCMRRSLQIGMALLVALTIMLSFVHPATSVLASRQAKLFGLLQLVAMAVLAFVLPVLLLQTRVSDPFVCAVDPAGASRLSFICSFLC